MLETRRQEKLLEADLQAQQDMSRWALLLFYASVVGIIWSAGGIYLLFQTLRETRLMTEATREVGEAQLRPFVDLKLNGGMLQSDHPESRLHLSCSLSVSGTSFAKNVRIEITAYIRNIITREVVGERIQANSATAYVAPGQTINNLYLDIGDYVLTEAQKRMIQAAQADSVALVSWAYEDTFGTSILIGPLEYWTRPTFTPQNNVFTVSGFVLDASGFYGAAITRDENS